LHSEAFNSLEATVFNQGIPSACLDLHLLQVLVTDFFGSVMGIKHTEAPYVGFTGRSKESTNYQKDSPSSQIVDIVNELPFDVPVEEEKVKCLTLRTPPGFDTE